MIRYIIILICLVATTQAARPIINPPIFQVSTEKEALKMARQWVAESPNRVYSTIAGTGSMRPLVKGGEYIMLAKHEGPLTPGRIYTTDKNVIHRAVTSGAKSGSAYLMGDNNKRGDGFVPLKRIEYVLEGIIKWE